MPTKLDPDYKVGFMEVVTFDTEKVYDSLYLAADGTVEIVPIHNSASVTFALSKGWHRIAFKQINDAGTDLTAAQCIGCRKYTDD